MKTPIETLIEKITALPYVQDSGRILAGGDWIGASDLVADCPSRDQASYLVHAANSLPKLLEALERTRKHWEGRDCGAQWYQDLEEALTQAREVKG